MFQKNSKKKKNNGVKNESIKTNEKVRYSKKDYKYANLSKLTYSHMKNYTIAINRLL